MAKRRIRSLKAPPESINEALQLLNIPRQYPIGTFFLSQVIRPSALIKLFVISHCARKVPVEASAFLNEKIQFSSLRPIE